MHRAGEKIRAWREDQRPPLTAEEFGRKFGEPEPWPSRTVYGWETRGKIPRPGIQRRLAELGICEPADWVAPAEGAPAERRCKVGFRLKSWDVPILFPMRSACPIAARSRPSTPLAGEGEPLAGGDPPRFHVTLVPFVTFRAARSASTPPHPRRNPSRGRPQMRAQVSTVST